MLIQSDGLTPHLRRELLKFKSVENFFLQYFHASCSYCLVIILAISCAIRLRPQER
jgi:hypothetical protein